MRVEFVERTDGPQRLVCDVELIFDENGPMEGMKLTGLAIWRGADGQLRVTFPARTYEMGQQRHYYDHLRSVNGTPEPARRLKSWILDEHRSRSRAA